jgi:hypothetical protein
MKKIVEEWLIFIGQSHREVIKNDKNQQLVILNKQQLVIMQIQIIMGFQII